MKATRSRGLRTHPHPKTGGCLLRHANFVSESERGSFEQGELAWKAGTLPAELLPHDRIHYWPPPSCFVKEVQSHKPGCASATPPSVFPGACLLKHCPHPPGMATALFSCATRAEVMRMLMWDLRLLCLHNHASTGGTSSQGDLLEDFANK